MHREGEESKCSEWQERSTKREMVKGGYNTHGLQVQQEVAKADSVHLPIA